MFRQLQCARVTASGRMAAMATLQCRDFCAWRPEWQRKKPSKVKVALAKERLKKSSIKRTQVSVAKQIKQAQEAERKYKKFVTFEPGKPDNVTDSGKENLLKKMKVFHATDSPFVYLLYPPEEIYEPDQYWNRHSFYARSKAKFFFIPPQEFDYSLPSGTNQGEVAFLGRSNVGKSSLMNALMQENLARTSKAPGRTQQVGYYGMFMPPDHKKYKDWRKATGYFVDLPGYGYARGPDDAVDAWQKNTQIYLLDRMQTGRLRRLYVLVDSRRPQQDLDWSIFTWLDTEGHGIPYSVVLTKADAIGDPTSLVPHLNTLAMRFQHSMQDRIANNTGFSGGQSPVIHVTSATKGMGLTELWKSCTWELGIRPKGNPIDKDAAYFEEREQDDSTEAEYFEQR